MAAVVTRRTDCGERCHGTWVADPYRWLEDDTDDEVKAWIRAQNAATEEFLAHVPERPELRARLAELFEIGSVSLPCVVRLKSGAFRYFYTRRRGSEDQPRLFVQDGLQGEERVLFDPNRETTAGPLSLDWYYPSPDGRWLAYGTSLDGSEDSVLRVRCVATGEDRADHIPRARHASVAWSPDGARFYYTRYPSLAPPGEERYQRRVFEHELGADPANDTLVFGSELAPHRSPKREQLGVRPLARRARAQELGREPSLFGGHLGHTPAFLTAHSGPTALV